MKPHTETRNIQSLDGLRAVSIVLVIINHICTAFSVNRTYGGAILGNGSLGVIVFFIISGYLVTHFLLREFSRDGQINLRRFYIGRALHILPPYYFYLFVIGTAAILGFLPITRAQFAGPFLFLGDYFPIVKAWPLEHLWWVSVSEQFYILWPAVLVLCLRRSRRFACFLAAIIIICCPVLRSLTYLTHSSYSTQLYYMLHTRMDSLLFGCFVAIAQGEAWFEAAYRRFSSYIYPMIIFAFLVSPLLALRFRGTYIFIVGYSAEGFCIAFSMLWLTRNPQSAIGKVLNWEPIKQVGIMSYSLYIWQTIFLSNQNSSLLARYPFNLAVVVVFAAFSYLAIETPSLALKKRFFTSKATTMMPS